MFVRTLTEADEPWKLETLEQEWGATNVARLGELVDAAPLPGFVALDGDERIGLLTYCQRGDEIEVVTLQALGQGRGVGRALLDAVYEHTVRRGATRLWLITTNDNVRAFGVYQQWGMDLLRMIRNGVDASRQVKPSIPTTGSAGIPLRHELEFEIVVGRR